MMTEPTRAGIDYCYRVFACWVARRAQGTKRPPGAAFVVVTVERYLRGEIEFEEVRAVRARSPGGMSGAAVCGMPSYVPGAAIQIADYHTAHESARDAAHWAMHFAARAAGFRLFGQAFAVTGHDVFEPGYALARYQFSRQQPHILLAGEAIELAFLRGELKCWLAQCCGGSQDDRA